MSETLSPEQNQAEFFQPELFLEAPTNTQPDAHIETHVNPEALPPELGDTVALGGLRRFITGRRLDRADNKVAEISQSQDAHKEVADILINRKLDEKNPRLFKLRDANPDNLPVTRSERRTAKRSEKQMSRAADIKAGHHYRLKRTYGSDIGTADYVTRINNARMTKSEKRNALKAHWQFKDMDSKARVLTDKVRKTAEGRDFPGRTLERKLHKAEVKRGRRIKQALRAAGAGEPGFIHRNLAAANKHLEDAADNAISWNGKRKKAAEAKRLSKLPPPPTTP